MRDAITWDADLRAVLEHWVCYLRQPGAQTDHGAVGVFHVRHCPAGEGHLALVAIEDRFEAICTDNPAVAEYVLNMMVRGRSPRWDRPIPTVSARFQFSGDIRTSPTWTIVMPDHELVINWQAIGPPVVAYRSDPQVAARRCSATVLFFADRAAITFDGQPVEGQPFTTDIWQDSIGEDRSSCCFALAETFITPKG